MRTVRLLRTGLDVSRLCLGTLNFGTVLTQDQINRHLDLFFAHGGNFVDTAHVYSNWEPGPLSRSEKMLGNWIAGMCRKDLILSTKGGHFDFAKPEISRVTPEEIQKDLRESLEYLQTEYIDLYFLHRDNTDLPVSVIMDCMFELIDNHQIRYAGCSNWTRERIAEANRYAAKKGRDGFVVNQLMWSMAIPNRDQIPPDYIVMDPPMWNLHQQDQMSTMCFSSQAKGYFARLRAGEQLGKDVTDVYQNEHNDRIYAEELAGLTPAEITRVCLQYFEKQSLPVIPIVSCDTEEQLLECMSAFE